MADVKLTALTKLLVPVNGQSRPVEKDEEFVLPEDRAEQVLRDGVAERVTESAKGRKAAD